MPSENIVSKSSRVIRTVESLQRFGMVHLLSANLPLYIVNSYPKSGSSWFSQMLAQALDVPYRRNRAPAMETSVLHVHYLHPGRMKNVVAVWRDGRDVMVSWYHHCLFPNEIRNAHLVATVRKNMPFSNYSDITENLPIFMEYAFTRPYFPRFSWTDFVRCWYLRKDVVHVHYEDLLRSTAAELQRVVRDLTGNKLSLEKAAEIEKEFSFKLQAKRQAGIENKGSFLRKGVAGDWRNYFDLRGREVFDHYAGDELILLGYESDRRWVDEVFPGGEEKYV